MSGRKRSCSIARLMVIVSIIAAESGSMRALSGNHFFELAIFVLPLLNFMALGIPKLRPGHPAWLFWVGFEVVGAILIGLIFFLGWYAPLFLFHPVISLQESGWIPQSVNESPEQLAVVVVGVVAMYALPQLLAAVLAGWLWSRYQIVRRPRATDVPAEPEVDLARGQEIEI
jgi:hypothetical protein